MEWQIANLNKVEKSDRHASPIIIQGEGRVSQDTAAAPAADGLENTDVEGDGDSSKAKRDGVVTPRPIIGILSQVNQK